MFDTQVTQPHLVLSEQPPAIPFRKYSAMMLECPFCACFLFHIGMQLFFMGHQYMIDHTIQLNVIPFSRMFVCVTVCERERETMGSLKRTPREVLSGALSLRMDFFFYNSLAVVLTVDSRSRLLKIKV